MLLAGLVSQKKERAVVGDPGTKLQHNSMYAGVAKIFSVHDLPEAKDQAIISTVVGRNAGDLKVLKSQTSYV